MGVVHIIKIRYLIHFLPIVRFTVTLRPKMQTLFTYSNYKKFLKDHLERLPAKGRGEINRLGLALGVHPTLVSQVLNGPKDFTIDQAHSLASYLGLAALEIDYFVLLIQRERAGTPAYRAYCTTKLDELKQRSLNVSKRLKSHRDLSENEKALFYSSWIYAAVRLFTSVDDGQTLEAVASRFDLSRARAKSILTFLVEVQLCSEAGGVFTMQTQHTHLAAGSAHLLRHHTNWRLRAIDRGEKLTENELLFTSPFSISVADFAKLREQIIDLIQTSSRTIQASPAEEVACLNIDLFWLD